MMSKKLSEMVERRLEQEAGEEKSYLREKEKELREEKKQLREKGKQVRDEKRLLMEAILGRGPQGYLFDSSFLRFHSHFSARLTSFGEELRVPGVPSFCKFW